MHDIFSREPDPLDGLLAPPSSPENEALWQTVYVRTRRVLRRRYLIRQFAYAAAVAASFALGLLAMWMTLPARSASKGTPPPAEIATKEENPPEEAPGVRGELVKMPALEGEWKAFDSAEHRGELYRQAGDRYMAEESDPQSALRCYANALDGGTKQDLTISTDDNWLLMAIKDARQKESDHAKIGG